MKGGLSIGALSMSVSYLNVEFSIPTAGARDLLSATYATYAVVSQSPVPPLFSFKGGLWCYRDRLFVLYSLCPKILSGYHDSLFMGHPGISQMLSCLSRTYA